MLLYAGLGDAEFLLGDQVTGTGDPPVGNVRWGRGVRATRGILCDSPKRMLSPRGFTVGNPISCDFYGISLVLVYSIGKYTRFRTERVYGVGILDLCAAKPYTIFAAVLDDRADERPGGLQLRR